MSARPFDNINDFLKTGKGKSLYEIRGYWCSGNQNEMAIIQAGGDDKTTVTYGLFQVFEYFNDTGKWMMTKVVEGYWTVDGLLFGVQVKYSPDTLPW